MRNANVILVVDGADSGYHPMCCPPNEAPPAFDLAVGCVG